MDFRARAQRYLALAAESRDPEIGRLLQLLAADFFELAPEPKSQQQQQIQPQDDP
jgi:hypothetical protein